MKVALYARYSSDNQRDASIVDQFRICRVHAEKQGWQIIVEYSDQAISGASLLRPGIQSLIADALRGRFNVVLAEAMDRLSRDQEDLAGIYKRLTHAGIEIRAVHEGRADIIQIGIRGLVGALRQVTVDTVVGNIQFTIIKPFEKWWIALVQHPGEHFLPADAFTRQFAPETCIVFVGLITQAIVGIHAGDGGLLAEGIARRKAASFFQDGFDGGHSVAPL